MNVGKCFHHYHKGKLLRRGVVVAQSATNYRVWLVDPFSGLLTKTCYVPITRTAKWEWFNTREESNTAYERHFAKVESK
jgi:hypothetical protein